VTDPDLQLVRALQAGDDSAFDELMLRHKAAIFAFICRYLRNEADAADLTQETFVRAYFRICSFKPRARFATWLFTIATNLCRDRVRSRAYRDSHRTLPLSTGAANDLPEPRSGDLEPDQAVERDERLRILEAAIDRLPHDLKTALILTAMEGLSHAEAAERLGVTAKTIETRVYRARHRLEAMLRNVQLR